ncbi:MAG: hypothetical protein ACM3W4_10885 [Ignavibacteriales bacterium]
MTIGPLPTPPGGAKAAPPQGQVRSSPAPTGAPAVGSGILGGGGLAFGPSSPPPKPKAAPQGGPVFVARPQPPRSGPAPHEPIPMGGVIDAYAKGARGPDAWPAQTPRATQPEAARPAPAPTPSIAPEPPAVEPVEDPGPAPVWMAAAETRTVTPRRTPLYVGAGALAVIAAIGGVMLLKKPAPEPAETPLFTTAEPAAPVTTPVTAPAVEPLRQEQEVATAEAPPVMKPQPVRAAKPRKRETVQTAVAEPSTTPAETAPAPVQVATQPLAVPPPTPAPVVQQPAPRIVIPHIDPNAPIVTRSSADQ